MRKAHFSFNSGHNINSKRMLALTAALLLTMLLGLFPAHTSQAQQNGETFVINDIITEDTIGRGIVIPEEVALDKTGNQYVLGKFEADVDFGEGSNSQLLNGTDDDLFVAKYDTNDNLVWIQEFETGAERSSATPKAIKFDDNRGNIYVAGDFRGELTVGAEQLTSPNTPNGFITQLNAETGAVQWVNQIISSGQITVNDISTNGNVVVTGVFSGSAEFPGQFGNVETLNALTPNSPHMYVALYDFAGGIAFAIQAGGGEMAFGNGITMRLNINAFTVVGEFLGTIRFPDRTGRDPVELTSQGFVDGFVARYSNGGQLLSVTQIAGPNSDRALHIVEKRFDLYVAGEFTNQTTIGSTTLTSRGEEDLFVARISTLDGSVQRVTQIGGDGRDGISGFDGDSDNQRDGNVFLTGEFRSDVITIGEGSRAIRLGRINSRTTYLAGISVDNGFFIPSFGQIVQGIFNPNQITVDDDSANFYLAGSYPNRVTFGEGDNTIELPRPSASEAMAVAQFSLDSGNNEPDAFYVSSTTSGTVDGIDFRDEDVLLFSISRQAWAMIIDGSDIGLGATDINAVHQQADGSFLLSVNSTLTIPDLGEIDDSDILRFVPETLGADTTGTLELFLRGADVGLTTNGEDIDAIAINADGRLVISTLGSTSVPGANGDLSTHDEDLLVRNGNAWELLFDGSNVGLTDSSEDISAASVDAESVILSTQGLYTIDSLTGDADDIFNCKTPNTGDNTQIEECTILLDGSANGLTGEVIDAFSLVQP